MSDKQSDDADVLVDFQILSPPAGSPVGREFAVSGTHPTNGQTLLAEVYPSGSTISIRNGNGIVRSGAFRIQLPKINPGANPHTVKVMHSNNPDEFREVQVNIS